jgi:DNA polymerase III delta subunit
MEEEFYHKNIFGEEVDISFADPTEEKNPINKKQGYFPGFAFTDAIGARDKKEAWIQFQRELASGLVAEQLFWSVAKQIKNLLLAKRTSSASEADLNPFVYKKLKANVNNFKEGELENLSEGLVLGYHQARRGKGEIEMLLEKMLLNLR